MFALSGVVVSKKVVAENTRLKKKIIQRSYFIKPPSYKKRNGMEEREQSKPKLAPEEMRRYSGMLGKLCYAVLNAAAPRPSRPRSSSTPPPRTRHSEPPHNQRAQVPQLPNKAPKLLLWKETVTESPSLLQTPQLAEGLITETITDINASCTLAHTTLGESCCVNSGTRNQTNRSVLLCLSIAVNKSHHVIPV